MKHWKWVREMKLGHTFWRRILSGLFLWLGFVEGVSVRGVLLGKVEVHARVLAETGNWKEAMKEVREALKTETNTLEKASLHELLGDLKVSQGPSMHEAGVHDYTAALDLDPQNGRLFFKRGVAAFQQNASRESAVNDLAKSLKLGYTNAETFYLMGAACKLGAESTTEATLAAESYVLAYRLFQQALVLDTNHVAAMGNLGDMAYNLGRHDEAAGFYRKVLSYRLEPIQTLTCKARLGHAVMQLKRFDEALKLLQEADRVYATVQPPADEMALLAWHLEGLRVLGYKLETLSQWGKKEEELAASRALLDRVALVKLQFDKRGATAEPLAGWEQLARKKLQE